VKREGGMVGVTQDSVFSLIIKN